MTTIQLGTSAQRNQYIEAAAIKTAVEIGLIGKDQDVKKLAPMQRSDLGMIRIAIRTVLSDGIIEGLREAETIFSKGRIK